MGETRTRSEAWGGLWGPALACVVVLASQGAMAQARSPSGDKSGAMALGGAIVQFEEGPGRAILYHEAQGGLVNRAAPPVERANGSTPAAPTAAAPKAASAKGPADASASTNGATPLRAPQRKAAPAEGVAMRP